MKNKHNAGFSLIEVLIAIALLGIIVVPTCSSLVMSFRLNAAADSMLQSQLAVSSAVETLMAEGISEANGQFDRFPDVSVETEKDPDKPYYTVKVASGDVSVETHIRAVPAGSAAVPTEREDTGS